MKLLKYITILALVPCLVSCEDDDGGNKIKELTVELDKTMILDDGEDEINITVKDQNDKDVTYEVFIYADQQMLSAKSFTATSAGTVQIHAEYKDVVSPNVEVTVVADVGLKFRKNVLIEQFTGTWCGWCPRAIYQVSYLMDMDTAINHVAYHLNDEFSFIYNRDLYDYFGFQYVPVMAVDRIEEWDGTPTKIASMHQPQRLGLSMDVEGDCNQLEVTVSVKFGKIFAEDLTLTVYVVHDSLVADQANYYDDDPASVWYQEGNPMTDFVHENTMVKTATHMLGDLIPADSVNIGSTYTKSYDITSFTCNDINHIEVVAFVSYVEGEDYFQVINSLACAYGEDKDYELVTK
jgi:hypothetical protein